MAHEGLPAEGVAEFSPFDPEAARRPPPAGLRLRAATPQDLDALAAMRAARMRTPLAENRDALERKLAAAGACLLVALDGDRPLGFASAAWLDPPPEARAPAGYYLTGVVVRPEDRRRGVATELTRARLAWIEERATTAYYFANARNRVSIALHAKFGFEELTRDFRLPGVTFRGGVGILFRRES